MHLTALLAYLDALLKPGIFKDYAPNGLQVEGRREIHRIVCGVTASQALLDCAVAQGADAVLVHHGYFWRGEAPEITGIRKKRLQTLLTHDINLIAYHLPLDAHPTLGNNAQLAQRMNWQTVAQFGDQNLGCLGTVSAPQALDQLVQTLTLHLARAPLVIGDKDRVIRNVGWCSGGAQSYFEAAICAGAEVFISGEISEHSVHLARESGVAYVAAGHHATERYGIRALAQHLREVCGLDADFVEIDNPV